MVLVVVHPAEQSGDELRQVRLDDGRGQGDGGDFDETESGLDDFAVLGGEEEGGGGYELGDGAGQNVICLSVNGQRS